MRQEVLTRRGPPRRKKALTKGQARREEVIKAAARLFQEKGYHATSMQDIANEVGLRKGSLYYHVASKQDLLFQIMNLGIMGALKELEGICATDSSPTEKLRLAVQSLVSALAEQRERVVVFLQELRSLQPDQLKEIATKRKRYEALFQQILEEGTKEGVFRLPDTKIAAYGLLGMCNWIHQWYKAGGRLSPGEIGQMFTELFLQGCLVRCSDQPSGEEVSRKQ
jgi:AcrR family transcriptional regulator